MELGDHPCCSVGCPVQISWRPQDTMTIELDSYEFGQNEGRRRGTDLLLPVNQRSSILLQAGYSVDEIVCAANEAKAAKLRRMESARKYRKPRTNSLFGSTLSGRIFVDNVEQTGGQKKEPLCGFRWKASNVLSGAFNRPFGRRVGNSLSTTGRVAQ